MAGRCGISALTHAPAVRAGWQRARDSAGQIAWVSLAAGVAFLLSSVLLHHPYPFFASVAAFSALGFSPDVQPRRVGEVALGVSLGVAIGELLQLQFGSGPIQTTVVVFIAAMIARVLDPSPVLTTQSAVQAIVVVGLPALASSGGPIGRWTDALLGGAVALVFSLFIPKDPRRRPRRLARDSLTHLAQVLELLASGLRTGDADAARRSLDLARTTQLGLVAWDAAATAASSTARLSPAWRRHAHDLAALADACEFADRATRGTRVLARRASVAVADGYVDAALAGQLEELGLATRRLGALLAAGEDPARVSTQLQALAATLGTRQERDPVRHTLLSLLRSVTFDLMRAAGTDERTALAAMG